MPHALDVRSVASAAGRRICSGKGLAYIDRQMRILVAVLVEARAQDRGGQVYHCSLFHMDRPKRLHFHSTWVCASQGPGARSWPITAIHVSLFL